MSRKIVLNLIIIFGTAVCFAQGAGAIMGLSRPCAERLDSVHQRMEKGDVLAAESVLSHELAIGAHTSEPLCTGVLLHNLGTLKGAIGQARDAERLEQRALRILADYYAPDDPALLNPLQTLAAAQLGLGKTTQAQKTYERILLVKVERPRDRAAVHGATAMLLLRQRRLREAEVELRTALDIWQQSGCGETLDAASALDYVAYIYIQERRWGQAMELLNKAAEIVEEAPDSLPFDWVRVLNCRAMVHERQALWSEAEKDLEQAVTAADQEPRPSSDQLAVLWSNYAYILRKNHKRREANAFQAKSASLGVQSAFRSVVDISDLDNRHNSR